jgi:hypothetical protein
LPLLGTTAWSFFLLFGLRPLRHRLQESYRRSHQLGPLLQASLFAGALFSAAITEWMGVHAIFGAFLWGLAMPRYGPMRRRLEQQLKAVVLQLLLPLFFAISGLSTATGSINTLPLLFHCPACSGRGGGGKIHRHLGHFLTQQGGQPGGPGPLLAYAYQGAHRTGDPQCGHKLGRDQHRVFTIGVVLALAKTVMTGPLLDRLCFTI